MSSNSSCCIKLSYYNTDRPMEVKKYKHVQDPNSIQLLPVKLSKWMYKTVLCKDYTDRCILQCSSTNIVFSIELTIKNDIERNSPILVIGNIKYGISLQCIATFKINLNNTSMQCSIMKLRANLNNLIYIAIGYQSKSNIQNINQWLYTD